MNSYYLTQFILFDSFHLKASLCREIESDFYEMRIRFFYHQSTFYIWNAFVMLPVSPNLSRLVSKFWLTIEWIVILLENSLLVNKVAKMCLFWFGADVSWRATLLQPASFLSRTFVRETVEVASQKRRYLSNHITYKKSKDMPKTASKWTKTWCIIQFELINNFAFIMC